MTSREIALPHSASYDGEALFTIPDFLILAAVAVILALPMLIHGPMVKGHDTYEHLNYCRHFGDQFWGGEWYPRWLLEMNHGLGSPTFFVYPPFAAYVYALLQPMGRIFHFNPFNAGELVTLLGSGICGFLWIRTIANRIVALASAVLYMLMPYHLSMDFYRRTALSECWALVWMPLVLYFATQVMTQKRAAVLGLAFAYALLILSHLVSVLIFSLIPLAAALILSARGERIKAVLRIAAGMALGTGLSCFYFLPALSQAKYFPVQTLLRPPYYFLAGNFISIEDLGGSSKAGFVHWVSLAAIGMIAFISICGLVVLLGERRDVRSRVIFWMAACVLPVFLMSSVSLPVWNFFPRLFEGVQYPWRFNIVLCLAAFFIGALFLSEVFRLSRIWRIVALALVSLIVLTWLVSYGQIWNRYRTDVFVPNPRLLVNEDDGWFDAWSTPELDQGSALKASLGPKVRFLGAAGTSDVRLWKARHIEFQTNSGAGGWVMVNQFYYPRWRASVVGITRPLSIKAAVPQGLLAVEVPPGERGIVLEIPTTVAERVGRWISVFCALLSVILLWKNKTDKVFKVKSLPSNEGIPAQV